MLLCARAVCFVAGAVSRVFYRAFRAVLVAAAPLLVLALFLSAFWFVFVFLLLLEFLFALAVEVAALAVGLILALALAFVLRSAFAVLRSLPFFLSSFCVLRSSFRVPCICYLFLFLVLGSFIVLLLFLFCVGLVPSLCYRSRSRF